MVNRKLYSALSAIHFSTGTSCFSTCSGQRPGPFYESFSFSSCIYNQSISKSSLLFKMMYLQSAHFSFSPMYSMQAHFIFFLSNSNRPLNDLFSCFAHLATIHSPCSSQNGILKNHKSDHIIPTSNLPEVPYCI